MKSKSVAQSLLAFVPIVLACTLFSSPARATSTTVWISPSAGDWFHAPNWSTGVPSGTADAFVNNGNKVSIDSPGATARSPTLGAAVGDSGTLLVDGSAGPNLGGSLDVGPCFNCEGTSVEGTLYIGRGGSGEMTITNGGVVESERFAYIAPENGGRLAPSSGVVTVDGANSVWAISGTSAKLSIGADGFSNNGGTALLTVTNGGSVIVNNGAVTTVPVVVGTSGTLTGNGTVTINANGIASRVVAVNGTLAPTGTLTLNSHLSLNEPATTVCNVTPSAADRVNVSLVAYLRGRLSVNMQGTFTPAVTRYTLLYAAGGRYFEAAQFTSVSINYPTRQNFTPRITYEGNYVYLDLDFF